MARVIKTLAREHVKKGIAAYPHREHRSKKGRLKKGRFDWFDKRKMEFQSEKEVFGQTRYSKKHKIPKFRL